MKANEPRFPRMTGIKRIKNVIVILVMLISASALLVYGIASKAGRTSTGRVRVLVNGEVFSEQAIRPGQKITVSQPDGSENVIMMTENGFYMLSANCQNQDCVHQGEVKEDNYMFRALGTSIICIPNRVEVRLILSDEAVEPDIEIPDV